MMASKPIMVAMRCWRLLEKEWGRGLAWILEAGQRLPPVPGILEMVESGFAKGPTG
jgi:hypothetical protein